MTAEEKNTIARFLDLATDYLKDGHAQNRAGAAFQDDVFADDALQGGLHAEDPAEPASGDFSSLPLAYQIDENENSIAAGGDIESIAAAVQACKACGLAATRTHAVPGEGAAFPLVMVIGEGPGADEDAAGRPFVGKAGQLLDKMLASIGLFRDKNCYIANMVKCRPPGNRDPQPQEIAACFPFLEQQIMLLRPRLILCVGRIASKNLLKTDKGINALRGTFAEFKVNPSEEAIPVLCTFHPSAILRDESLKRPAWEDLKLLNSRIENKE